jgi:heme/copper-type cytochrome/quinol oxidase subunit 3
VTRNRAQLGMAMFLISEAVFFFLLILACAYFHALPRLYAPSGWILTALLLAGSVSIWRRWRWGAIALDAVFLMGLAGIPFAMLTAVLGLFVLAGVIALAVVPASGLRALSLYWYFFTAVWLVIFGVAGQV